MSSPAVLGVLEKMMQDMMAHSQQFDAMLQEAIQEEAKAESEFEKIHWRETQERQRISRDGSQHVAQIYKNLLFGKEKSLQQGKSPVSFVQDLNVKMSLSKQKMSLNF